MSHESCLNARCGRRRRSSVGRSLKAYLPTHRQGSYQRCKRQDDRNSELFLRAAALPKSGWNQGKVTEIHAAMLSVLLLLPFPIVITNFARLHEYRQSAGRPQKVETSSPLSARNSRYQTHEKTLGGDTSLRDLTPRSRPAVILALIWRRSQLRL